MPKSKKTTSTAVSKGEVQVSKSPAEFFAENQAIAGFDNYGRSLYTSIRELMENSLDACESINELPSISVSIEEFTQEEFNVLRGLTTSTNKKSGSDSDGNKDTEPLDTELFVSKKNSSRKGEEKTNNNKADGEQHKKRVKASQEAYFRIKVRDNGCGMRHDDIPNLLGRVLSGSKYGVRQTRGKFGLGAKMALIWSKKSTGVPIKVTTAHRPPSSTTTTKPPTKMSTCVLDIDIYKNCPRIMEHKQRTNTQGWIGTEMELLIAGNWTTYKSRIVQYLQQLAIITPYAQLEMTYKSSPSAATNRNLEIHYDRRSNQMPAPAREVKHHPSSVNNLLIQQLLQRTKCKTFLKFLTTELSAVSATMAKRLIAELVASGDKSFSESMHPSELDDKQITRLVQLLRSVTLFKAPDGSCLSPLGEYNLDLGIRKVLEPTMVATARDKPGAYEGHPFIVEAAVCLGGGGGGSTKGNSSSKQFDKEGITVFRFANRIPLLFEGGADVSSRVAHTKIRWSNYKMDHKRDKIGVFVSIVSTKIPYKGTGKEYIGDDIIEIQQSVKRALQNCCNQLKSHLTKRNALRDIQERKSRLVKYVPDVGRALFGLLDGMRQRHHQQQQKRKRQHNNDSDDDDDEDDGDESSSPLKKKLRLDSAAAKAMIRKLDRKEVTEASIKADLKASIEAHHNESLGEDGQPDDNNGGTTSNASGTAASKGGGGNKNGRRKNDDERIPIFLVALNPSQQEDSKHDIYHPLFTFRPFKPIKFIKKQKKIVAGEEAEEKKQEDNASVSSSVVSISD